jgi:hypothetical protein
MAFLYTEGIVYLNFHFIRNSNGGGNFGPSGDNNNLPNDDNLTGMQVVNDILERLNNLTKEHDLPGEPMLEDPNIDYNNQDVPSCRKLPWRFEIYTDANNSSDIYDGIWLWNSPNYEDDLAQVNFSNLDYQYMRENFQPYGDYVLDIYFVEFKEDDDCMAGYAPETSTIGNGIFLFNSWKSYNKHMLTNTSSNHLYQGFV